MAAAAARSRPAGTADTGASAARPSLARCQTVREKWLPRASAAAEAPWASPA